MLYIRSDSSSACNQITRVDEAQVICVIKTTLGLFENTDYAEELNTHPECSSELSRTHSKTWLEQFVFGTTSWYKAVQKSKWEEKGS